MSKIDEIINQAKDCYYTDENQFEKNTNLWEALEQLRPYIELGEIFRYSKYHDEDYLANDGLEDIVDNLIQQIKELENGLQ